MEFRIQEDIALVLELLTLSKSGLARQLGISRPTLDHWMSGKANPRRAALDAFYGYAFSHDVPLNEIKAQLYKEELERVGATVLFHGSKSGIQGPLSLTASRPNNDFGQGFYCGESLEQSALFVTHFPDSSLFMVAFDPTGLRKEEFNVDRDWMLAVASYRGRLREHLEHPLVQDVRSRVENADYLIAPIAGNRMYETIDLFIDGEITDLQCQHSLSATNLGKQYVFTTQRSLDHLRILEQCFLSTAERKHYEQVRQHGTAAGLAKAKAARRQYRNQGLYIEELLS